MKGDHQIIEHLNQALKGELTAINQYFLHARMFKNWGLSRLDAYEYRESIDEMKHADRLIERILFLEGLPNLQDLGKLYIGEHARECLECDLKLELEGHAVYKRGIAHAHEVGDPVTRDLLTEIITEEEGHIDWIETQLELMDRIGVARWEQTMMGDPTAPEAEA
ncbi:bacterioferritin [Ectothiorhodospira mobilis]|uniref:bacterioferritin n=1 Tax=Ectothiorhodospira mobilis TaxID=195064 RepID=UPI001EE7E36D|nr:bacterioferritin [Ectothiorhodospira mobilis]MCG5535116.1 bacterioferritin [Ectothiorhodospira mobilis]